MGVEGLPRRTNSAALFDAYPDASVLYIHRDPVQVTASRIKMALDLHEGLTGEHDVEARASTSPRAGPGSTPCSRTP